MDICLLNLLKSIIILFCMCECHLDILESFTPDGHPLMGPNPDVIGLYHSHAFNSGGVMMSGGSGLMLAQWIIYGQPELDMFDYDIR